MAKYIASGDVVRCIKTLRIDPTKSGKVIKHNILYVARSVKTICCQPLVDIGYEHHTPIVTTCSCCGKISKPSTKLYIPIHYFIKARSQKDALTKLLDKLERQFAIKKATPA